MQAARMQVQFTFGVTPPSLSLPVSPDASSLALMTVPEGETRV